MLQERPRPAVTAAPSTDAVAVPSPSAPASHDRSGSLTSHTDAVEVDLGEEAESSNNSSALVDPPSRVSRAAAPSYGGALDAPGPAQPDAHAHDLDGPSSHSRGRGLPMGAQAAPLQPDASAAAAPSSSSSSSSSVVAARPSSPLSSLRAQHIGRTPPPPLPEYQRWGQGKAVGAGGKAVWAGLKIFSALEFVGEVFADFFGLYDSRYQYVVDAYERNARELAAERAERSAARSEARERQASEDAARAPEREREQRDRRAQQARAEEQRAAQGDEQQRQQPYQPQQPPQSEPRSPAQQLPLSLESTQSTEHEQQQPLATS